MPRTCGAIFCYAPAVVYHSMKFFAAFDSLKLNRSALPSYKLVLITLLSNMHEYPPQTTLRNDSSFTCTTPHFFPFFSPGKQTVLFSCKHCAPDSFLDISRMSNCDTLQMIPLKAMMCPKAHSQNEHLQQHSLQQLFILSTTLGECNLGIGSPDDEQGAHFLLL